LGLAKNFVGDPRVDKMAFNKTNLSAGDIAFANIEKFPEEKVTHNFILHLEKRKIIITIIYR
jgi:hypothetical protein